MTAHFDGTKLAQGVQAVHPDDVSAEDKRIKALILRGRRKSYRAIAKQLKISPSTAYAYVSESLAEMRSVTQEKAQEVLDLELHELDRRQAALRNDLTVEATKTVLKIQERRSKLLGLDAPTSFRLQVPVTDGDGPGFAAGLDLKKMSTEELRALEAMYAKYGHRDEDPDPVLNGTAVTVVAPPRLSPGSSSGE